jgi:hypothetical protein
MQAPLPVVDPPVVVLEVAPSVVVPELELPEVDVDADVVPVPLLEVVVANVPAPLPAVVIAIVAPEEQAVKRESNKIRLEEAIISRRQGTQKVPVGPSIATHLV